MSRDIYRPTWLCSYAYLTEFLPWMGNTTRHTWRPFVNWDYAGKWIEVSYILILREAFFAVLDVRFAIDELLGGFDYVLLVCNLSAEEVAGLRWVREGIGRIDLPGESLIKRSHNTGPVQTKQLRACHGFFSFFLGSGRCLCSSRRSDGRQPLFTSGMEQKRFDTEPGK